MRSSDNPAIAPGFRFRNLIVPVGIQREIRMKRNSGWKSIFRSAECRGVRRRYGPSIDAGPGALPQ
jgi:hypothetical protein